MIINQYNTIKLINELTHNIYIRNIPAVNNIITKLKSQNITTNNTIPLRTTIFHDLTELSILLINELYDTPSHVNYALRLASHTGNYNLCKYLIENKNANVNTGQSIAVINAAEFGYTNILQLLIHNKVNVNAQNNKALTLAINNNRIDIIKYITLYNKLQTI